jgi:hypothetical protein
VKREFLQGILQFPQDFDVVFEWLFVVIVWSKRGSCVHGFWHRKNTPLSQKIFWESQKSTPRG